MDEAIWRNGGYGIRDFWFRVLLGKGVFIWRWSDDKELRWDGGLKEGNEDEGLIGRGTWYHYCRAVWPCERLNFLI